MLKLFYEIYKLKAKSTKLKMCATKKQWSDISIFVISSYEGQLPHCTSVVKSEGFKWPGEIFKSSGQW